MLRLPLSFELQMACSSRRLHLSCTLVAYLSSMSTTAALLAPTSLCTCLIASSVSLCNRSDVAAAPLVDCGGSGAGATRGLGAGAGREAGAAPAAPWGRQGRAHAGAGP